MAESFDRSGKKKIPLCVIAGPTASGKTALAVETALQLNGEVVSADSMQIYRGFPIATARPTQEEMKGIPHHLLGFLDVKESFSVAQYVIMAHDVIQDIASRGRLPILAGGTGLYISSVVDNLVFDPMPEDVALKEHLRRRVEQEGGEALLEELRMYDPETAAQLHPNNVGRIIRALEVYQLTGNTMSEQRRKSRTVPSPYHACMFGLNYHDREKLYQ